MSLVVQSRDVLLVTAGHHHQPPRSTGSAELQRPVSYTHLTLPTTPYV